MKPLITNKTQKILQQLKPYQKAKDNIPNKDLQPLTLDDLYKLKKSKNAPSSAKNSKISEETNMELQLLDNPKKTNKKKSKKSISEQTERTLSELHKNEKHSKNPHRKLSPDALTILSLLKHGNSTKKREKKQTLKLETEEMLSKLSKAKIKTVSGNVAAIQSDIIRGVNWESIWSRMKQTNMTIVSLAVDDNFKLTDVFMSRVLPAMCLYDVASIKDMVSSDTQNFLAFSMLNRLLQIKNIEPSLDKVAILIQHVDPSDPRMATLLSKTFTHDQWFSLFHLFKESFPYINDDTKNTLASRLAKQIEIKKDYANYLMAARELRFNIEQMKLIDGSGLLTPGCFEKVAMFEGKVEDYYKTKSVAAHVAALAATGAATAAATGSAAVTGGVSLLLTLGSVTLLGFQNGSITIDEYRKQKMICETLFRSASERGLPYHTDYKTIRPILLSARIDKQQKLSLETEEHAAETERWWQTAIHTPLTIENGVAALLDANNQGTFEALGSWIDSKIGTSGQKIEIEKIKQKIEALNDYLKPIKDDLEKYERMAVENVYRCKYLKSQVDCCLRFHPSEDYLSIDVEKAEETLEKLSSYKKILEHLFELSETRLKIAQFKESVHYQRESDLLDKIRIIAASVSGGKYALPPKTRNGPAVSNNPPASLARPTKTSPTKTLPKRRVKPTTTPSETFVNSKGIKNEKLWNAVHGNGKAKGGLSVGTIREILSQNGIDTSSMLRKNMQEELAKLLRRFNIQEPEEPEDPKNDEIKILSKIPKNQAAIAQLIADGVLNVGDKFTSSGSSKTWEVINKQGRKRQIK